MKTDSASNEVLNYYTRATTPSVLTPYLGMLSDVAGEVETTGSGYARVLLSTSQFGSVAAGGSISNTAAVEFPSTTGPWDDSEGFGIWNAASGGTLKRKAYFTTTTAVPFTGATDDTITAPGHGLLDDDRVVLLQILGATIPTGLSAGNLYYVINATADTFQVSLTQGGGAENITAAGGGLCVGVEVLTIGNNVVPTFDVGDLTFTEF